MYYHASQIADIKTLQPSTSNHNTPLIYFSTKRENVLVYLSNAVEKHCKETGFFHNDKYYKWASYGFDSDGILRIDEFYPNSLSDTYKGVSGYIYKVAEIIKTDNDININSVVATSKPVSIDDVEFIEDAYSEIHKACKAGLIRIRKYEDMSKKMLSWIENTVKKEYEKSKEHPEYRCFLEAKFSFLKQII